MMNVGGITQYSANCLFSQTNSVTVANTVTETAISGTGIGTLTLPANFFVVGKTITLKLMGFHSSTGGVTIRVKVKFGSTVILDTTALASKTDTNAMIEVSGMITCRTTGVSGTVIGQGFYSEFGTTVDDFQMVNTATTTIDTTASQAVSVSVQWGTASASNTITSTNFILEVLN